MRFGSMLAMMVGGLIGLLTAWLMFQGYEILALLLDSLLFWITPNKFDWR